jgi:ubiquinone biosynthesis protein UbiJ
MAMSRVDRISDLERMVDRLEERLAQLNRAAARASAAAPDTATRMGEAIASALGEIADRFRSRARSVGRSVGNADLSHLGEDALQFGNDALRKLAKDVERKPLVLLAVAVGVGVLAAGLLARRD